MPISPSKQSKENELQGVIHTVSRKAKRATAGRIILNQAHYCYDVGTNLSLCRAETIHAFGGTKSIQDISGPEGVPKQHYSTRS